MFINSRTQDKDLATLQTQSIKKHYSYYYKETLHTMLLVL